MDAAQGEHLTDGLHPSLGSSGMVVDVAGDVVLHLGILIGLAVAEAEVLELGLHLIESEAVGQGRVEVVGLRSDLQLLVGEHRLQGAHVVKAVGQLEQQGTDIVVDGLQHLLVVVHL